MRAEQSRFIGKTSLSGISSMNDFATGLGFGLGIFDSIKDFLKMVGCQLKASLPQSHSYNPLTSERNVQTEIVRSVVGPDGDARSLRLGTAPEQ
jgi:hypothetical protein